MTSSVGVTVGSVAVTNANGIDKAAIVGTAGNTGPDVTIAVSSGCVLLPGASRVGSSPGGSCVGGSVT